MRRDARLRCYDWGKYKNRIPGSRLVTLTAETGGRWHHTIPPLVRKLAKEYLRRTPGLEDDALGAIVARWGARLSALLIRDNGVVVRSCCDLSWAASPHVDVPGHLLTSPGGLVG